MKTRNASLLLIVCCAFGIHTAMAQQLPKTQAAGPARQHLNKIFSTSNPDGPLSAHQLILPVKQLMLLWGQSYKDTVNTGQYSYNYQILSEPTPVSTNLDANGSLSGDSVTVTDDGSRIPAIKRYSVPIVLSGDMNGNDMDEVASVWETPQDSLFVSAQQIDSTLNFRNSGVTGTLAGTVRSTGDDSLGLYSATMADLLGDGKKELVIAWSDMTGYSFSPTYQTHISVYGWSDTDPSHLALLASTTTGPTGKPPIAVAAGDFEGNGRDEIALAGYTLDGKPAGYGGFMAICEVYLNLYLFNSSHDLVAKGTQNIEEYWVVKSSSGGYQLPVNLTMTTGDINGNGRDEIVLSSYSLTIAHDSYGNTTAEDLSSIMHIAEPKDSLKSIVVAQDLQDQWKSIALTCADLNGTGKDEIVYTDLDSVKVDTCKTVNGYLEPAPVSSYNPDLSPYIDGLDFERSGSFMRAGDIDEDGKDEIVLVHNKFTQAFDQPGLYGQAFDIKVLGSTDNTFDLSVKAEKTGLLPVTTYPRYYSLALGDFNGSSLRLGMPQHFHVTKIVQPLVVLNAPPVQFDVFNGTSYDVNGCFNGQDCNFVATYSKGTTNTEMMQTSQNSSWGIGASLSGEFHAWGTKVSTSLDTHYGQDFSKVQNSSYATTVNINVAASKEDEIYALVNNYDIWEYPVTDHNQLKGHVLVTVPGPPQSQWFDTESWAANSFIPDHVVGNILSYRSYSDNLDKNPDILQKIYGSFSNSYQLNTSDYNWSLTTSKFSSTQADTTKTFNLNVSASVETGGSFLGIGASVKAGVSGDYSNSGLTSHTSSVENNLGLSVDLGPVNSSIGEDTYSVTPYAYWSKEGALVINYAVDPSLSPPGGTETWWQKEYGHAPDPAFALPYLNWPTEGFTVTDPAKVYQTKEILCYPDDPQPGDTVTTAVRIHNYSLVPTDTLVGVSFYIGDPDAGGTIIKSITGDSVFWTPDTIAARGSQIITFKWVAPSNINSNFIYNADYTRIYGVIDPQNKISEVHENNNKGWNILEIPGINTAITAEPGNQLPTTVKLYPNYPNPFNPTTTIHYALPAAGHVRLIVYDVLGRRVAQLVDTRQSTGNHEVRFNASQLASGVYFYRLQVNNVVRIGKMMLIK